jgi:hypothetical protein
LTPEEEEKEGIRGEEYSRGRGRITKRGGGIEEERGGRKSGSEH